MDAENAAIIDIKWATHDTKVPTVLSRRIYLGLRYAESSTDGACYALCGSKKSVFVVLGKKRFSGTDAEGPVLPGNVRASTMRRLPQKLGHTRRSRPAYAAGSADGEGVPMRDTKGPVPALLRYRPRTKTPGTPGHLPY
eukprot:3940290-Rhodomonas_salina.3